MMLSVSKIVRTAQYFGFKNVSYFLLAINCLVDWGAGGKFCNVILEGRLLDFCDEMCQEGVGGQFYAQIM
jgi:hypothetical protein